MALSFGTVAMLDNTVGVSDMCLLDPLSEDAIIENLQTRFRHGQIYVSEDHITATFIHFQRCSLLLFAQTPLT